MTISKWRIASREVIKNILLSNKEKELSEKELLKLISKSYPFDERKYMPYQI